MRIMAAQLPHFSGDTSTALRSMLMLLSRCENEARALGLEDPAKSEAVIAVRVALANLYVHQNELVLASETLRGVCGANPANEELTSILSRIFLQMGNLDAARDVYERHECTVEDADGNAAVRAHRGLLAMAAGDYVTAVEEFGAAAELKPSDSVSVNNKAVCLVYLCRLTDAMELLESFIKTSAHESLDRAIFTNLSSMYSLQSDHGGAQRRAVEALASALATDDMDGSRPSQGPHMGEMAPSR